MVHYTSVPRVLHGGSMAELTDDDLKLGEIIALGDVMRATRPCPPCGGAQFADDETCRICSVCGETYLKVPAEQLPIVIRP